MQDRSWEGNQEDSSTDADRLKTVRRLASGVAHELGTPLNVVSGRAQLISSGKLSESEVQLSASAIRDQADRMATIIGHLLDFACSRPPRPAMVDLRNVVREAANRWGAHASDLGVAIGVDVGRSPCLAKIDIQQIEQVVTHLVVNAIQAMPDGGRITLEVSSSGERAVESPGSAEGGSVCFVVRDTGTGIAKQHLPHLFEPFFTTRLFGEGAGLGLSIAHGIVQSHGGHVEMQSTEGAGSCFTVFLPAGELA